jgi:hypothetical protein
LSESSPAPESIVSLEQDDQEATEPLTSVNREVTGVGTFSTPQGFAYNMQRRDYQAFALDIGKVRDQKMRVKVPDLDLDLIFVKAGACR